MAFNSESDEVADDYRRALEDLTGNLKYEINNLTLIARESTEHAHSIADVIADHILKVGSPSTTHTFPGWRHRLTKVPWLSSRLLRRRNCLPSTSLIPLQKTSALLTRSFLARASTKCSWNRIHHGRPTYKTQDGGDAEDVEGTSAGLNRP